MMQGKETLSRLKSTNLTNFLLNDPLWIQVVQKKTQKQSTWKPYSEEMKDKKVSMTTEEENYFFEKQKKTYNKESELFESKYISDSIPKSRIILEHSNIVILATLCDSLEWLSSKLLQIFKLKSKSKKLTSILEPFSSFGIKFEELSDSSLISLRTEMRHHCFSFLAPIQTVN